MKVAVLRDLIDKLRPEVQLRYRAAVNREFPALLENLDGEEDLPLDLLLKQSRSHIFLNMFGVLYSMQHDSMLKRDAELFQDILSVIQQVQQEMPSIPTEYGDEYSSRYGSKSEISDRQTEEAGSEQIEEEESKPGMPL